MKIKSPRDYYDLRITDMKTERSSWDAHWRELATNFSPRRSRFSAGERNKGNRRNNLINNTPLFARRVLRSGMMTGITSPARPWFRLEPPDAEMGTYAPVRSWLDAVETLMYRVFAASNLYKSLPTVYNDLGVFGTAAMIEEEDFEDVARFTNFVTGEYMVGVNGYGRVDTFGRDFELNVEQVVSRYGLTNASSTVKNNWDNGNYRNSVSLRHVVEPADRYSGDGMSLPPEMKYRSVVWDVSGEHDRFLSVKGYREFPVFAPRWEANAGDSYGFSPGMDALGDAKALQVQEKEKGKAVAKQVAPPLLLPSSLQDSAVSTLPGAVNFDDDPNKVARAFYQVNASVSDLRADMSETEERINRAFYVDLFLMISSTDMTPSPTDVAIRQEEKLIQLGPVLENVHDELLDPLIDRTFNMIMRAARPGWMGAGPMLLPPPPPELSESEVRVEYISILAQAQKLVDTSSIERFAGFVGNVAQLRPEILDKLNPDKMADKMAEDLGVPPDVVNADDEVAAIRQQRAEAEQGAALQAQAAAAVDGAKVLSETPTTGETLLTDILGAAQ